jgi:sensor histidine kinase YesM
VIALAVLCIQQLVLEVYVLKTHTRRFARFALAESRPVITRFASANTGLPLNEIPPPLFFRERYPRMVYFITLKDALSSGIVILLLSGFIKLAHSLFISEKQKKILENERLNAELNFLKLQINPHFLFNTLNSIYSQAHFKSEQTEHSILKFSRIMRYVLYDSSTDKIPLSRDLEYISNYIDLQQLRLSKNITIHYDVTGPVNGLSIAPLLLITFIENAFKHGISYTAPSEIKIAIAVTGNELSLTVGNAITQSSRGSAGGVGLINARRRLDVIYPGRHMLDVIDNDHLYIVNLKIELDHES